MLASKKSIVLFLKGMSMGLADSVPGVSGGTVALITGIYEELINSIKSVNLKALSLLLTKGPVVAWNHINGNFLLTLMAGILTSLILAASAVSYLLVTFPQLIMCFFIGLIIASCSYIGSRMGKWNGTKLILLSVGILVSISLSFIPLASANLSLWYVFICGAFAICAMILPGISGAFILILLGVYEPILLALKSFDFKIITVFIAGCVTGLMTFSNVLAYLFEHFKEYTLSFLLGILAGSLFTLWPWRIEDELIHGRFHNLSPVEYNQITGNEVHFLACFALVFIGFILVYGLEKISSDSNS